MDFIAIRIFDFVASTGVWRLSDKSIFNILEVMGVSYLKGDQYFGDWWFGPKWGVDLVISLLKIDRKAI